MPSNFFVDAILRVNGVDVNKAKIQSDFDAAIQRLEIQFPTVKTSNLTDVLKKSRNEVKQLFKEFDFKDLQNLGKNLQSATTNVARSVVEKAVANVEQLKDLRIRIRGLIQENDLSGVARTRFITGSLDKIKQINRTIDSLKEGVDTAFNPDKQKANFDKLKASAEDTADEIFRQGLALNKVNTASEKLVRLMKEVDALTAKIGGNLSNVDRVAEVAQLRNNSPIRVGDQDFHKSLQQQQQLLSSKKSELIEEKNKLKTILAQKEAVQDSQIRTQEEAARLAKKQASDIERAKRDAAKNAEKENDERERARKTALRELNVQNTINQVIDKRAAIIKALEDSKGFLSGAPARSIAQIRAEVTANASPRGITNSEGKIVGVETSSDVAARQAKELIKQRRELAEFKNDLNSTARAHRLAAAATLDHESALVKFGRQTFLAVKRYAAFLLPTTGLFAVIGAVRQGIAAFKDYEIAQTKLEQVLGSTKGEADKLGKSFRDLASQTGVSLSSIEKGLQIITQAGFGQGPGGQEQLKNFAEVLAKSDLAPTFDNIDKTTEGLVAIFSQFGLKLEDTNRILEVTNQLSKDFAVESSDIFEAVRVGGSSFATLNGSFEDFASLLTLIRSQTRESAATLGTFFKSASVQLFRKSADDVLRGLDQNLIFTNNITDRLIGLAAAFKNVNEVQKIRVAEQLVGVRQAGRLLALTNAINQQGGKLSASLGKATGSLDEDASKRLDDLTKSLDRAREAFNSLLIAISDSTTFKKIASAFADIVAVISQVGQTAKNVLGPGLLVGGALLTRKLVPDSVKGFFSGTQENTLKNNPDAVIANQLKQASLLLDRSLADNNTAISRLIGALDKNTSATLNEAVAETSIIGGTGVSQGGRLSRKARRESLFGVSAGRGSRVTTLSNEDEFFSGQVSPVTAAFAGQVNADAGIRARAENIARIRRERLRNENLFTRPLTTKDFFKGLRNPVTTSGIIGAGSIAATLGGQALQSSGSARGVLTGGAISGAGIGASVGLVFGPLGAAIFGVIGAFGGLISSAKELGQIQESLAKTQKGKLVEDVVSGKPITDLGNLFQLSALQSQTQTGKLLKGSGANEISAFFGDDLTSSREILKRTADVVNLINTPVAKNASEDDIRRRNLNIGFREADLNSDLGIAIPGAAGGGGRLAVLEQFKQLVQPNLQNIIAKDLVTPEQALSKLRDQFAPVIDPKVFDTLAAETNILSKEFRALLEQSVDLVLDFQTFQATIQSTDSLFATFGNEFSKSFEKATLLLSRRGTSASTLESINNGKFIPQLQLSSSLLLKGSGIQNELKRFANSSALGRTLAPQLENTGQRVKERQETASILSKSLGDTLDKLSDKDRLDFINQLQNLGELVSNRGNGLASENFVDKGTIELPETALNRLQQFLGEESPLFKALKSGQVSGADVAQAAVSEDRTAELERITGAEKLQASLLNSLNSTYGFLNEQTKISAELQQHLNDRLENLNKVVEQTSDSIEKLQTGSERRSADLTGRGSQFSVQRSIADVLKARTLIPGLAERERIARANNIDLLKPQIRNPDGSFSTERTITAGFGQKFFNIPTIVGGKQLTEQEAIEQFKQGKNKDVGSFDTLSEALTSARNRTNLIGSLNEPLTFNDFGFDKLNKTVVELNDLLLKGGSKSELSAASRQTIAGLGIDTTGKGLFDLISSLSGPLDAAKLKSDAAMESLNKGLELAEQAADTLLQSFKEQLNVLSELGLADANKTPREKATEDRVFNRFASSLESQAGAAGINLHDLTPEQLLSDPKVQQILQQSAGSVGRKGQNLLSGRLQDIARAGGTFEGLSPDLIRGAIFAPKGENALSRLTGVESGLSPEDRLKAFRDAEKTLREGTDATKALGQQRINVAAGQATVAAVEAARAGGKDVNAGATTITAEDIAKAAINKDDLENLAKAFNNIPDTLTVALNDFSVNVKITGGNELVQAIMPAIASQLQNQINQSVGDALAIIDPSIKQKLTSVQRPPFAGQPRG